MENREIGNKNTIIMCDHFSIIIHKNKFKKNTNELQISRKYVS